MNDKVAENIEEKEEASLEIDKAFVKEEARVLDPTLLNKPLLDRMPTPTGWRILVLPYRGKGVTEGGIQLVKETMDRESLSTVVAYVLKVGPLAYKETEKYGNKPWCQEKDWVLIGRYAGSRFRLEDDHEVRIINDDDVIGTILDPDDIKSL
jgi:co-chaperonin GroES (HSP10)|tara:strand:- start:1256 stop:1711 length:456 start_codon:yes stop_codon:yes gene_type:complete